MENKIKELEEKLSRKEQECERLRLDLIEAKAHGDYLNNLALSETLNLVSEQHEQLKAELEQETALKETYLACYKAKHEDIEGELFKLRQYKKSKQASYEALQKKCNELELENRKLKEFQKLIEEQMKFNKSELELTLSSVLKELKRVDKQKDNWREKTEKYNRTLTEIKELLLKTPTDSQAHFINAKSVILQKICEVIKDENI